jgi:hypothetical protein
MTTTYTLDTIYPTTQQSSQNEDCDESLYAEDDAYKKPQSVTREEYLDY